MRGGKDVRPDRHALLELDALLAQVELAVARADRARFDFDDRLRWVLHRLWIAVGNEALKYAGLFGRKARMRQPWRELYLLRNKLAHGRLPDVDEDEVWWMTSTQTAALRARARKALS